MNGSRGVTLTVRAVWGVVLLASPGPLIRLAVGDGGVEVRPVARVLGVRHVAQAALLGLAGRRRGWWTVATAVDGLHVTSLLAGAAVGSGVWRRAAIVDVVPELAVAELSWRQRPVGG